MRVSLLLLLVFLVVLPSPVALTDPVILDVSPTGWDRPYAPVQMLALTLDTMGCRRSYDELMVLSGAAFRSCWRDRNYNFPALVLYQQDPISLGAIAVGAMADRRRVETEDAAFAAIVESIDRGAPVIAWDDGRSDIQIICGYDADDGTILRRTIDTGAAPPEEVPVAQAKALMYTGAPFELWILTWEGAEQATPTNWPLALANAVRLADWPPEERVYRDFICGDGALEAWATDMRDPELHEQFPQAGYMAARLAWHLQHARATASRVLQTNAVIHPRVLEAALLYQDEAALFGEVHQVLCGGSGLTSTEAGRAANENIANDEIRLSAADLVEQALAKDQAARTALTEALGAVMGQPEPLTDGPPGQG